MNNKYIMYCVTNARPFLLLNQPGRIDLHLQFVLAFACAPLRAQPRRSTSYSVLSSVCSDSKTSVWKTFQDVSSPAGVGHAVEIPAKGKALSITRGNLPSCRIPTLSCVHYATRQAGYLRASQAPSLATKAASANYTS